MYADAKNFYSERGGAPDTALFRVGKDNNMEEIFTPKELPAGEGLLSIPREQTVCGVCGAAFGNLGAWCRYECELLSPRRFVRACGTALRDGTAQELLTARFRETVTASLFEHARDPDYERTAGILCNLIGNAALNCGWKLTGFRLESIVVRKEGIL